MNTYLTKELSFEDGMLEASACDYGLVHSLSTFDFGDAKELFPFDPEELVEARFFTPETEIHFFKKNGEIRCLKVTDGEAVFIDEKRSLVSKFKGLGKKVVIRKYLEPDEDGQMIITGTRLVDVER